MQKKENKKKYYNSIPTKYKKQDKTEEKKQDGSEEKKQDRSQGNGKDQSRGRNKDRGRNQDRSSSQDRERDQRGSRDQGRGISQGNQEFGRTSEKKNKRDMKCKYLRQCGACSYIEKTNEEQLQIKQKDLTELLESFAKVDQIIGMKNPYHYRNKVHAAFGRTKHGEIIAGTYQANTHQIINIDACKIDNILADKIIITIRELIPSFKIKTYDEDTGYGLLRHVLIRQGHKSGEVLIVLVTGYPTFPSKKNFSRELVKRHPEITTIVQSINNKKTSMVLGDRENVFLGKGYIIDELCGLTFKISPRSFYQVNSVQTEVLYNKAMEFADLQGGEMVIDAYCGIGTIGMLAAKHAKKVISIELNREAVKDAIINCKHNQIENLRVYQGDAGDFMDSIEIDDEKIDVVFMDPPRIGSTEQFMDSVVRLAPEKVIYISCSPLTLERDLSYFIKNGYQVEKIQPVDMFPWTEHVECCSLLVKK